MCYTLGASTKNYVQNMLKYQYILFNFYQIVSKNQFKITILKKEVKNSEKLLTHQNLFGILNVRFKKGMRK